MVGGWGQGLGGSWGPRQLTGPGSREGPGQTDMIVFLGLREKEERTMLGPQKEGPCLVLEWPVTPQGHVPLLSASPRLRTSFPAHNHPRERNKTKPLSFLPQPPGGAAWDPSRT